MGHTIDIDIDITTDVIGVIYKSVEYNGHEIALVCQDDTPEVHCLLCNERIKGPDSIDMDEMGEERQIISHLYLLGQFSEPCSSDFRDGMDAIEYRTRSVVNNKFIGQIPTEGTKDDIGDEVSKQLPCWYSADIDVGI